jgi:predicted flap endonuclease-1-like 5' DNA nuclease
VSWFVGQSLVMLILAFLLGLLVGYLLWGRRFRRLDQASAVRATDPSTVLPHRGASHPAGSDRVAGSDHGSAVPPPVLDEPQAHPSVTHEPELHEPLDEPVLAEPVAYEPELSEPLVRKPEPAVGVPVAALPVGAEPLTAAQIADETGGRPVSLFDAAGEPEPTAGTRAPGQVDRLELIEGIGPKIAQALRTAGIDTFARLAGTDEPTLRAALAEANLRFAPSLSSWAEQARLLAAGDHAGHAALTAQLVAGRSPRTT